MTNIPKKLDFRPHFSESVMVRDRDAEMLIKKINELIDYLQANKPVGCCCIKKHSTGEVSKKDKYLCYTCNQWGIVGEHECEASKGECKNIECLKKKVKKNIINHSHAIYEELYPPEHEEEWEQGFDKKFTVRTVGVNSNAIKQYFEAIKDYIRDNFVSKEKIKREITSKLSYAWCKELFNSLGLGD